jgi:hypothetical protein
VCRRYYILTVVCANTAVATEVQAQDEQDGTNDGRMPKTLNLNTYKWHALGDVVPTIRLFGTTDLYSTQIVSAHGLSSEPAGQTWSVSLQPERFHQYPKMHYKCYHQAFSLYSSSYLRRAIHSLHLRSSPIFLDLRDTSTPRYTLAPCALRSLPITSDPPISPDLVRSPTIPSIGVIPLSYLTRSLTR